MLMSTIPPLCSAWVPVREEVVGVSTYLSLFKGVIDKGIELLEVSLLNIVQIIAHLQKFKPHLLSTIIMLIPCDLRRCVTICLECA